MSCGKKCCFCAEESVPSPHKAELSSRGIFASHTKSPRASCCSFFGQCSFVWSCPVPRMDTWFSGWLACAYYGPALPALPLSCSPPGALLQMAMTKDVFGGSRVIHGQNCPILDEISQKLDLYSDRPKRGRVYAGRASQSSTHGGRPRFFPAAQILHEVRSVNVFAHTHTLGQTRPVRMHTP